MFNLEPLGENHNRGEFDCGVEALNRYLKQTARQHEAKGIARTYVLSEDSRIIAGFFTLTYCQVDGGILPEAFAKKLPQQIPAMRLGRLAVSLSKQRQGIGHMLISSEIVDIGTKLNKRFIPDMGRFMFVNSDYYNALHMVGRAEQIAGGVGLFVDAKDNAAASYYAQFGFVPLVGAPLTLFLPIQTIRKHNAELP